MDTSPALTQVADSLHSEDPCGYPVASVGPVLFEDNLLDPLNTTPILSVMGSDDKEFSPLPTPVSFTLGYQKNIEFALNTDVTTAELPNTPQALTLGSTAPKFDAVMAQWLCARRFGAYSGSFTDAATAPAAVTSAPLAVTSAPAATTTGAALSSTGSGGTGSGQTLPVTGASTLHELSIATTLLLLGGTLLGLSTVQVARRRSRG